jgi:hypothetical protein
MNYFYNFTRARAKELIMRQKRSDSIDGEISAFQNASTKVELPESVILRNDEELVIWEQFTAVRPASAWRDFDLVLLAKAVRLEYDIRKIQLTLDSSGPLIKNKRETLVENPLLRVIDTLQRMQLAIIRSLSLNQTDSDPRTLNAQGMKQQDAQSTMESFGLESLISMPNNAH